MRSAACTIAVLCCLAVLAPPRRYEVDGLSMAPGLLPGDVVGSGWFPLLDRLRRPRRHERWILALPDGTSAIKRVVGLPGETISIRDGDLAIGGHTLLSPPHLLAKTAVAVGGVTMRSNGDDAEDGPWQTTVPSPVILDDAPWAPAESRMLLPVRDIGLAAVMLLRAAPVAGEPVRVRIRVGDRIVPWRIMTAGRYALVAGRLDGHLVGAAWPIPDADGRQEHTRSCLPPHVPPAWDIAEPWRESPSADAQDDDTNSPVLALGLTVGGVPVEGTAANGMIEHVIIWRDIFYRPAADGVVEWRLGPDAFFVLGDFPSASRDSRHWGPLGSNTFRSRAAPRF